MVKVDSHRFQGIAGRSNIPPGHRPYRAGGERPTSNVEWGKMKKQTYDLEKRLLEYSVRIIKIVEQLPKVRIKRGKNVHPKRLPFFNEAHELSSIFITTRRTAQKKVEG